MGRNPLKWTPRGHDHLASPEHLNDLVGCYKKVYYYRLGKRCIIKCPFDTGPLGSLGWDGQSKLLTVGGILESCDGGWP